MSIDVGSYLADSLAFRPKELELCRLFAGWLPDNIIDCHSHSGLPEHVGDIPRESYCHPVSTFPSFSIEQSEQVKRLFYPGKIVRSLRFAMVFRGIDHRRANQYLIDNDSGEGRVALFGLPQDVNYTIDLLRHPRIAALKMYHSSLFSSATSLFQYFKPEILGVAETCGLPIILHLPKSIVDSMGDLRRLVKDFPRLSVVIAHLGPTDFLYAGLEDALWELAGFPNVYMDTSLNSSKEVIRLVFRIFGARRIMYGSDEPLNLIRGMIYTHPEKGDLLITEFPYHWINPNDHARFSYLVRDAVHWHWASLLSLREVILSCPAEKQDEIKQQVFYDNACKLFCFHQ